LRIYLKVKAYQHLSAPSQVPEDCPRALHPAEQAQSPKKHRNPASLLTIKLKQIIDKNKTFMIFVFVIYFVNVIYV
jgi:hypothetical protein